jgi:hypothetical protein
MTDSPPSSSPGISPTGKPSGKKAWNLLLIVTVVVAIGLFIWSEQNRRGTAQQLEDTARQLEEIKASSRNSGEELANEILEKVNDLVDIPLDPRPTVATISDIDRLKEANDFFSVADNGDYLILTGSRALLYDPDRNIVLDVAPFQINRESPSPAAGSQQSTSQSQTATSSEADEE